MLALLHPRKAPPSPQRASWIGPAGEPAQDAQRQDLQTGWGWEWVEVGRIYRKELGGDLATTFCNDFDAKICF